MSFLRNYAKKLGVLEYKGLWDAEQNSPSLSSGVGSRNTYYVVSVAGTTALDGVTEWQPKDWVVFNGLSWEKLDNTDKLEGSNIIFVDSKEDLPEPVSGVITLGANKTYFITGTIDLAGDRLVGSQNTTIIGGSSENCFLISTGLSSSTALLSSAWSIPLRNISITHGTALNLDATGNANFSVNGMGIFRVSVAGAVAIQTRTETAGQTATLQPNAAFVLGLV